MHVHHFIGRQVHHDLRKQNHFLNSISFSVTRGPGRKKHREVYVYHANILIQVVISNYLNNHSSKAVYFFPRIFFSEKSNILLNRHPSSDYFLLGQIVASSRTDWFHAGKLFTLPAENHASHIHHLAED